MVLQQEGDRVHGVYSWNGPECAIYGRIQDGRLGFTYEEPTARGEGWFVLHRAGKFEGRWRQDGDPVWRPWIGERGFEGVWDSSFGMLRLIQEHDRVLGFYEGLGSSTV